MNSFQIPTKEAIQQILRDEIKKLSDKLEARPDDGPAFQTAAQVKEYICPVSKSTLDRWHDAGMIRAKTVGKKKLFCKASLYEFLNEHPEKYKPL